MVEDCSVLEGRKSEDVFPRLGELLILIVSKGGKTYCSVSRSFGILNERILSSNASKDVVSKLRDSVDTVLSEISEYYASEHSLGALLLRESRESLLRNEEHSSRISVLGPRNHRDFIVDI